MSEQAIPTPPQTPPPSTPEIMPEVSLERLDSLLETYLELLDQYTTLRTRLSKQISDGFFALARANHTSPSLGSGRRYGEEAYDERMKAVRRIVNKSRASTDPKAETSAEEVTKKVQSNAGAAERVEQDAEVITSSSHTVCIQNISDPTLPSNHPDEPEKDADPPSRAQQQSSNPKSPQKSSNPTPKLGSTTKQNPNPKSPDPLHWFGILVPQTLRQCQSSFISAVSSTIPALINTLTQMGDLEIRITNLRIELRLQSEGPNDVNDGTDEKELETNLDYTPKQKATQQRTLSATPPRKRLVQQPAEPRSRILKLDG